MSQVFGLARNLAEHGDPEMKAAMYGAFASAGFARAGYCGAELIKLDGFDALIFIAERFSADAVPHDMDV